MTDDPRAVLTERLDLTAVHQGDLDPLYRINADPGGWGHDPAGRHLEPATTREWIARAAARWADDGLSYWTVRLRGTPEVIGIGGVQLTGRGNWNLFYRLDTAHWGHGYATEIARAGIDAAHRHSPDLPVHAMILPHNRGSRGVAERLGLTDHGLGLDPFRREWAHLYADRPEPGWPVPAPSA
ncbi:GNAT family N-acetyltransferase [Kitasatospora sp. NPDC058965]|uniref:GNAT family N-acetyltransferase n=1 Tax=Kitasatospora sp. NPDC058965 TaxID=3346682 RepID=UPI0036BBC14C